MTNRPRRTVLSALALAALAAPAPGQEKAMLEPKGFAAPLAEWQRRGPAEFAADPAQAREGRASVRITVAPGAALNYQQISRDFTVDVRPGDTFRAEVWMRSRDVDGDPGAYMALEFLGGGDSRAGIAHSRMGAGIGRSGWEKLTAEGTAPSGTRAARLSLIVHAHGTAWFVDPTLVRTARMEEWPDLGGARRDVTVRTGQVVHPRFGGVGFHAFHHIFPATPEEMDTVLYKRWQEIAPSFARLNDEWEWDREKLDRAAAHILRMKQAGTQVYITTWNPPDVKSAAEMAAWARKVADNLEYLIEKRGCTNIRWYCMSNELSLSGWGKMSQDLPRFKEYHQALYNEFHARKLDVGLLATDASPIDFWPTIEWAAENMDPITAVYGGHHYINDRTPDDERFYPWFLQKTAWGAGIAKKRGKDFILGEFGSQQDGRTIDGKRMDACVWWGTPQEPMVAIQVAEAAIAAINGGVYALGYWTYMDLPDDYSPTYMNKWGIMRCSGSDRSTRDLYYAYGLLTRFFRGPATVFRVECADPRLRAAAVRHHGANTWSVAVVNRNVQPAPLRLVLDGAPVNVRFRKYVHDPKHPAQNPFGDMPPPAGVVAMKAGLLEDTVAPDTLTVYTTGFDEKAPAAVRGLKVERTAGGVRLSWQTVGDADRCYYRVYRGATAAFRPSLAAQVVSTVAVSYTDTHVTGGPAYYRVVAVDRSGNAGRPSSAVQVSP